MLSIITPVLNGAEYIKSNLDSISNLNIPYEHIIVDGGSTDDTLKIIKEYPNVRVIHQNDNKGMYSAIHTGFLNANGKHFIWLNSDDYLITENFEKFYNLCKDSGKDFNYSNAFHFYPEKKIHRKIYAKHFARFLLKMGVFPFVQSSIIFTKHAYDKVGGLNFEKFKIIGDRDLFQRIAFDKTLTFKYYNIFTSFFLIHNNSLLHKNYKLRKLEQTLCIRSSNSKFFSIYFKLSNFVRKLKSSN